MGTLAAGGGSSGSVAAVVLCEAAVLCMTVLCDAVYERVCCGATFNTCTCTCTCIAVTVGACEDLFLAIARKSNSLLVEKDPEFEVELPSIS